MFYNITIYTSMFYLPKFENKYSINISYWNILYYTDIVVVKVDPSNRCSKFSKWIIFIIMGKITKVEESPWIIWAKCLPSSGPINSSLTIFNRFSYGIIFQ